MEKGERKEWRRVLSRKLPRSPTFEGMRDEVRQTAMSGMGGVSHIEPHWKRFGGVPEGSGWRLSIKMMTFDYIENYLCYFCWREGSGPQRWERRRGSKMPHIGTPHRSCSVHQAGMGWMTSEPLPCAFDAGEQRITDFSPQRHRGHRARTQRFSWLTPTLREKFYH